MMKIFEADKVELKNILNREIMSYGEYEGKVRSIIADVRERGDKALKEYAKKFDGVELENLAVTSDEIDAAYDKVDAELKIILETAAENISVFHKQQVRKGFEIDKKNGVILGQKIMSVERAGIYVPGGTAAYPSTVLMNAIPAKIAGVNEIYMCTPPQKDGSIKPEILIAARLAGVTKIYKVGGAGAIAAMAYGTESIPKVDKVVGPGNIYVALAKREVFGVVGIDMVAGPTEILVIADETASPKRVAADLLSQAEHDRLATPVLVTPSDDLAADVQKEVEKQLEVLPRRDIATESIENNGKIVITKTLDDAIRIANEIAPEHLEICAQSPFEILKKVRNAGAVFLGMNTPEAVGDYYAGTNHTLPTSGSAKFSSPLSVDDFIKKSNYIYYPEAEVKRVAKDIARFADSEGLHGHAASVLTRLDEKNAEENNAEQNGTNQNGTNQNGATDKLTADKCAAEKCTDPKGAGKKKG